MSIGLTKTSPVRQNGRVTSTQDTASPPEPRRNGNGTGTGNGNGTARTRGGWTPVGTSAARRSAHRERGNARGDRTRRSLLDAARRVFERRGYIDANVEEIVTEAGVARGSFYTYFPSKVEIFRAVCREVGMQIDSAVAGSELRGLDPVAALTQSIRGYFEAYRGNTVFFTVLERLASVDPEIYDMQFRTRRKHIQRIAAAIRRWQSRGVADPAVDSDGAATALVSMTTNFCYWWIEGPEQHDDDEAALAVISDIWVRALGLRRRPKPGWVRQAEQPPDESAS
jgi:AcrR family transcriptional regulator